MAITRIVGVDAVMCSANLDATNLHLVLKGYNFSHTAAGSMRIVGAGPAQTATLTASTNAFLIDRVTTTVNAKTVFFEGHGIPLPRGFKVYMTGTLILYV